MKKLALVGAILLAGIVAASCGSSGDTKSAAGSEGSGGNPSTSASTGGGTSSSSMASGGGTSSSTASSASSAGGGGQGGATGSGGQGGSPCPQGTITCNGNVAEVCDGMGGFESMNDCGAQVCVPTLGCLVCVPSTGTCNGDVGTSCKADGSGFVTETCDALTATTCNPSTGKCDGACGAVSLGTSYIGCDYWPTVSANAVSSVFHFAVAVSNTTASSASITITKGANVVSTVNVAPNDVQVIQLPWVAQLKGPDANILGNPQPMPGSVRVNDGAYRLRSTQPVTVYQFNPLEYTNGNTNSYSNDASLLLPVNVWTGTYRVVAWHHSNGAQGTSGYYVITAKDDATTVNVTAPPGAPATLVKNGVAGIPQSGTGQVVLDSGDVIEVVTGSPDTNDVTGTLVVADKPVQVLGGQQCANIPTLQNGYCDHIEESMFPYETLSTEYVVTAPLIATAPPKPKVQVVRVVATTDATTLTYEPAQAAPAAIAQAGQFIEITNIVADFKITSNNPVIVMQYMEGSTVAANGGACNTGPPLCTGDPAMALAIATQQYRKSFLFHAPTNYSTSFVNVVCPNGGAAQLDNVAMGGFTQIGNSGFSVARQQISNAGNGNHTLLSNMPCGLMVYGYGQDTSYWYPGGSELTLLHM